MGILRPGGTELTRYALERAGVERGMSLLDIGCGDGTAAAEMQARLGLEVTAIDTDEKAVEQARARGLRAAKGDAAMLEFPSRTFDCVLMECVFSVLERQEESIHEAYCVLKPGGKLIISDVYARQPDMERYQREHVEALKLFYRPRNHDECGTEEHLPSPYCQDGAVVLDGLRELLEGLGLKTALLEDRTEDLKAFVGQAILDCGSLEAYLAREGSWKMCGCSCASPGYFLLIAEKPDA